jgi:hypothetical protein
MPSVGFEPTIPFDSRVRESEASSALDRAATVMGSIYAHLSNV